MKVLVFKILNNLDKVFSLIFINRLISLFVRSPKARNFIAEQLKKTLPKNSLIDSRSLEVSETLKSIDINGYCLLNELDSMKKQQIIDYLMPLPLRRRFAYGKSEPFLLNQIPNNLKMAEYLEKDLVECPHLLEIANSPFLLELSSRYLGCKPTISSLSAWWSFAGDTDSEDTEQFHRDLDDWRFIKFFIYLTDVDLDTGPHTLVAKSHHSKKLLYKYRFSDKEVYQTYPIQDVVKVTGKSGSQFIANTFTIHKGERPLLHNRLVFQIIYSMFPTPNGPTEPIPTHRYDQFDPYINRIYLKARP